MNIVALLREETAQKRNKVALRQGKVHVTYGGLFDRTENTANDLRKLGIDKFSRVGLFVPEGIDYVVLNLALLSLPAVVVPIPLGASEEEVNSLIQEMKINFLIGPRSFGRSAAESYKLTALTASPLLGVSRFASVMPEQNEFESVNPAFIRFTSGTTGKSKGVVISHEAIRARTDAADHALKMTEQDVVIWVLSMSFHFVVTILLFLRRASEIVLCDHELPRGIAEGLEANDATFIYASPLHYAAMVNSQRITTSLCRHLRMAVSTAVSLDESTAESFAAKFGLELTEAYGIIEVGLPFVNLTGDARRPRSVGRVLPAYESYLRAPDDDGVGIVNVKGPGMFDAYLSPWKTREQVTKDGWFETNDLGRFDEQGFLYLLGRQQNVINFMGMKIFPAEVERVINQYPAVKESCVYGVTHKQFGQIPCARVVLTDESANFDPNELRRFCYQYLAAYKVPKQVEQVIELEKTLSGKTVAKSRAQLND